MERDVVLLRILVMKVKETVTDLVMEVNLMVILAAKETLSVVPTIVNYLATIIIRRTIVARGPTGLSGAVSARAVSSVGRRPGPGSGHVDPTVASLWTLWRYRRKIVATIVELTITMAIVMITLVYIMIIIMVRPTGPNGAVSAVAVQSVMVRRPEPEGVLDPSVERQDGTFRRHRREFVLAGGARG